MWRSIAAKSRVVARNFGTKNKVSSTSQSHFSIRVSSKSNLDIRFLSHLSANPNESGTVQNVDGFHFDLSNEDSSTFFGEKNNAQLDNFASEGGMEGLSDQFSQGISDTSDTQMEKCHSFVENGDTQMENFAPGDESVDGLVEESEKAEEEVYEIDVEKLENVLSLLQSSVDESLESNLESLGLNLHEEFVLKVIETPLVLGENLIRFFRWAKKKHDSNATTHAIDRFSIKAKQKQDSIVTTRVIDALVGAICSNDLRRKNVYSLWDLVKEVGQKNTGVVSVGSLNQLIVLLSKLGKGKAALEVFDKFEDLGCVQDSETYYYTVEALCRRSFYDWAWTVCEKMLDAGVIPDSEKVGKIISWFCKGSKAEIAHTIYMLAKEKNKYPPQSSVNFLIGSLCREDGIVKLALEMLDDFKGEARKYAIKPFSSVIRCLCRSKDLDGAKQLLSKMIVEGPPPGNAVFNAVINGYSKAGYMKEAIEIWRLMESRGLKPDVYTYTVIMSGYVNGGQMEEACKILSEAKKKHSKLSPATYHSLIRGYCKLEQFDKSLALLAEMEKFGVQPNVDEYNKLIQSLCFKALDWGAAEKLFAEMKEKGLYLNSSTRSLITAVKELEEEALGKEENIEA